MKVGGKVIGYGQNAEKKAMQNDKVVIKMQENGQKVPKTWRLESSLHTAITLSTWRL